MHDTLLHVVRIAQKRTEVTAAQVTRQQWLAKTAHIVAMRQQASLKLAAVREEGWVQWNIPHVQRAKCKVQRAKGKVQRAQCKGQSAKGKGQSAKGKGQSAKGKVLVKEVETLARKNATLIQYQVKALLIRKQLEKCAYKSTQSLVSSLWASIFVDCATHVISLHCLCFNCEQYCICNI